MPSETARGAVQLPPRISQQQFNKQNPGGAIGGGSIVPTPDSCKAANSIILDQASLSLWPKTWRRSTTPHLPSQRATKGRKSGPFGVYRKVLADRVAAKSFSKYEIVKGIACRACTGNDGATSSRASDVDARERMLVISPRELKMR